jgi:hypothetical protein
MLYRNETEIYSFQDGGRMKKLFCGAGAGGVVVKLPPGAEAVIKNYGSQDPYLFYQIFEEIL